jgi:hypothetical protein
MMDKNEKDIFKKGIEKAPHSLSNKVLNAIEKEEMALTNLLKKDGLEKAPTSLNAKVMAQINAPKAQPEPNYTTFWIGIVSAFVGIIIMGFVFASNPETQTFVNERVNFEFNFSLTNSVTYVSYATFAVSFFLLIDFYLRRQRSPELT